MTDAYELDDDQVEIRQKLKAALYFSCMKISEECAETTDVTLSRQVIAGIAEATWKQCQNFAEDLEMFAKHARRTTVSADDVKLLTRRSPKLQNYISQLHERYLEEKQETKKNKKTKSKRSTTVTVSTALDTDEDSTMG